MGDDLKIKRSAASARRQCRDISKIVVHKRFSYSSGIPTNDIAIIKVAKPFFLTETFSPVNVSKSRAVDNEPCRVGKWKNRKQSHHIHCFEISRLLFTAGWGTLTEGINFASENLMAVNISVIPTEICNGFGSYGGRIGKNTICAGSMGGGRDACQVKRPVKMSKFTRSIAPIFFCRREIRVVD